MPVRLAPVLENKHRYNSMDGTRVVPPSSLRFDCDFGLYRIGNETIVVGRMMHLVEFFGARFVFAGERDLRFQGHFGDRQFAFGVLFHVADRFINIVVHDELLFTRDRQKGQHMTTRERRDKRLLGINLFWIAQIGGRSRSGHFVAAIKLPSVIARILLIIERRIAPLPGESNFVFGHVFR